MDCVLLVEDNALNRMVVEDVFEYDDMPAALLSVESGEEALLAVSQRKPLLVLMDLELPGMSGQETMRRLKEDPRTRDVPVWALSAHAMKDDVERALAAGFDAYVTKPIDTKQFARQLREFMAGIGRIEHKEPSSCNSR